MANALQEQLLKAGLASKQKVRDVKTQKKRNRKSNIDDGSAELKAQIAQQKKQQAEKDKALNEQRFAEAQRKVWSVAWSPKLSKMRWRCRKMARSSSTIPWRTRYTPCISMKNFRVSYSVAAWG